VLPVAFGFALWLRSQALFQRFAVSLLGLFVLGFAGYVLFPQAPPWIAGEWGVISFTHRIGVEAIVSLPVGEHIALAYDHIRPNEVAAMPSLHAALPLLLTLILWRLNRPLALGGAVYTAVLGFFLVYHGEHYVVDLLAGWVLAGLVYWLVWATPAWLPASFPRAGLMRRPSLALPLRGAALALLVMGVAASLRPGAFGSEPANIRPAYTQATPEPSPPPLPEVIAVTGPCGTSRSLAGMTDELLAPVAGVYAAYLIDTGAGVCLSLTADPALPPPNPDERRGLIAAADSAERPLLTGARGEGVRLSAVGVPGPRLLAVGIPPGHYLLTVSLQEVPDARAAGEAALTLLSELLTGG
jgi:hypothetical protein